MSRQEELLKEAWAEADELQRKERYWRMAFYFLIGYTHQHEKDRFKNSDDYAQSILKAFEGYQK
jgi:hypothetical protein